MSKSIPLSVNNLNNNMKDVKNRSLKDLFHEFIIFVVIGLGITLPVLIYSFADFFSKFGGADLVNAISFTGAY